MTGIAIIGIKFVGEKNTKTIKLIIPKRTNQKLYQYSIQK